MSKEVIAVDIDEVMFPFVENFVLHDDGIHGSGLTAADFRTYKFEDVMKVSMEEAVARVYSFNGADHSHVDPLEEAQASIEALGDNYDLTVVTARHPRFEANTLRWLNGHFHGVFDCVTFIGYAAVMEKPRSKAEVCHSLGAVALIDDSIEHVEGCVAEGIEGVLFGDYPWNQTEALPRGITRCVDWQAVRSHFGA